MPGEQVWFDEETFKALLEQADMEGTTVGKLASSYIRSTAQKRASESERPKTCPKCAEVVKRDPSIEPVVLEWHLTAQDQAVLYAICPRCGWKYYTTESYRTSILRYLKIGENEHYRDA